MLNIPRIHHTVWVGPKKVPDYWIDTWKKHNPSWLFILWDEERIRSRTWMNQKHLDFMFEQKKWPGVADICRMEILLEYGGFMPGADSVCLRPIDELFEVEEQAFTDAYACYENETVRPGLITPILASQADTRTLLTAVMALKEKETVGEPWQTTGNQHITDLMAQYEWGEEELVIWPSHYLIPNHYGGAHYVGDFKPYADHMWGSTTNAYK
jgi:mannosyltransferase OCH1-like enzyme